jgi:hypothetical protein
MAARLAAALPRLVILILVFLLATATLTFAAGRRIASAPPAQKAAAVSEPAVLVVPDVRGQAYVFAKGILEDGGFAWRVTGAVGGFAANLVAAQTPAPGTQVVDTGAPTIVVRLARNPSYAQEGTPENASPFRGTEIRLPRTPKPKPAAVPRAAKTAPAKSRPAAPKTSTAPKTRKPAFLLPGAPPEPLGEISLPERARRLDLWLSQHRRPTAANVRAFLFQHSWVVTGAKFGWWRGEQALRLLIRVDRRTQRLWRIGAKNERVARRALVLVQRRSR